MIKTKYPGNGKTQTQDRGPAREENLGARKDQGFRELLRRYMALRVANKNQNSGWAAF